MEHKAPSPPKPPPPHSPPQAQEEALRKGKMVVVVWMNGFSEKDVWKRTGIVTGPMVGFRGEKQEEGLGRARGSCSGEKRMHYGGRAAETAATSQDTTNAVAAANFSGVARRSESSDREIRSL